MAVYKINEVDAYKSKNESKSIKGSLHSFGDVIKGTITEDIYSEYGLEKQDVIKRVLDPIKKEYDLSSMDYDDFTDKVFSILTNVYGDNENLDVPGPSHIDDLINALYQELGSNNFAEVSDPLLSFAIAEYYYNYPSSQGSIEKFWDDDIDDAARAAADEAGNGNGYMSDGRHWTEFIQRYGSLRELPMYRSRARKYVERLTESKSIKESVDPKNYKVFTMTMDVAVPADKSLREFGVGTTDPRNPLYNALSDALESVGLEMAGSYVDSLGDVTDVYKSNDYEFFTEGKRLKESEFDYDENKVTKFLRELNSLVGAEIPEDELNYTISDWMNDDPDLSDSPLADFVDKSGFDPSRTFVIDDDDTNVYDADWEAFKSKCSREISGDTIYGIGSLGGCKIGFVVMNDFGESGPTNFFVEV